MTHAFITRSAAESNRAGELLAPLLAPADVLSLSGDLGAGKTQLSKGVASGLGVVEPVTSPTFNILLVHQGRLPLYHFDLYRLEDGAQLEDIDYFATVEGDGVSVVEWGDRFAEARPIDGIAIDIAILDDELRRFTIAPLGPRGEALAAEWTAALQEAGTDTEVSE